MFLHRFLTLFSVILLVSAGVSAKTVTFDGSACAKAPLSPCNIDAILGAAAGALKVTDDIIVNGIKGATYVIAGPLACNSLNIANGIVVLANNMNLNGLLTVGPAAQLIVNADKYVSSCSQLKVDGLLTVVSGVTNVGSFILNGAMNLKGGQLNVNNMQCNSGCKPQVSGGIIKHTGQTVYNAIPIINGGSFLVDGVMNLNNGITCIDKCTLNMLKNSVTNLIGQSTILVPVDLDAAAKLNIGKGNCNMQGLNGDANSILALINGGILNLNGATNVPTINVNGPSDLNINANVLLNNLNTDAAATVNVKNGVVNLNTKANCNSDVNLFGNAQFVVAPKAVANMLGGMKCSDNSAFNILNNANVVLNKDNIFNKPVTVGPNSVLSLANGVTTCNGINTDTTSIINLDKATTLNLNNNANLGALNLNSGSNLLINHGNSVVNGPLTGNKDSIAQITNAALNVKNRADLDNILQLNKDAKLTLAGISNLNHGIRCADSSPVINVANQVNLNGISDLKGLTNINPGGVLNLNGAGTHSCNNINTDSRGTLNVNKGCALKIDGIANLSGINQLIDNAHLIVNGQTNLLSGIKTTGTQPSNLSITKTGNCNVGAPSTINGIVLIDGNMNINAPTSIQTLTNNGNMAINKPCNILSNTFTQNNPASVINLNAGGSLNAANTIDLVKGTVNGVGALKCGTCNLGNNINANLNIEGNVVLQPTCNLVAKINPATGTVVPMIVGSGNLALNGVVDLSAMAVNTGKQAAAQVIRLITAPNVTGMLSVKPMGGCGGNNSGNNSGSNSGNNSGSNSGSNSGNNSGNNSGSNSGCASGSCGNSSGGCPVYKPVIPTCKCACEFHRQ